MVGDFIHCLSVVKNICALHDGNAKANIYLTDDTNKYGGDRWRFSADIAQRDLSDLVYEQPYVNRFELLTEELDAPYINLNAWRTYIDRKFQAQGFYNNSWTEFLAEVYKYEIPTEYKWLEAEEKDKSLKDKIVIHCSPQRHNPNFPWKQILNEADICLHPVNETFMLVGAKDKEIKTVSTFNEMATVLNSCKYFIGNQSAPFALASALDIPRMVVLDVDPAAFYKNEEKYSSNVSWYLNDNDKYISSNCPIKL